MTSTSKTVEAAAVSAAADDEAKARVRQFLNVLEQIPRLCSPTICGTLSQPTTKAERASRTSDMFEWSMEQKAILSPANITTDIEGTEEWHNVSELNPAWRQHESEMFFSQRAIAPSPLVTPSARRIIRPIRKAAFQGLDEDDEEDEDDDETEVEAMDEMSEDDDDNDHHQHDEDDDDDDEDNYDNQQAQDLTTNNKHHNDDYMDDDMFFSPRPINSQQRMDISSPDAFVRSMDETTDTLQSTPKTTGSSQRTRRSSRALI